MTTQQPQVARPTAALPSAQQQSTTQGSAPQQSKPAFVSAQPQSKPAAIVAPKIAAAPAHAAKKAAPIAKKPIAKPAAKKAAPKKKAVKKADPKKAAAKPAFKPTAKPQAAPSFSNNNNKQQAATAAVSNITAKATESLNEAIAASKQNLQVALECGNTAASISKSIQAELSKLATQAVAQNTQAVQKFFACRTASDLVNLSNSLLRSQADNAYSTSLKLAELATQFTKVAEPLNARIADAAKSLTKFGK